SPLIPLPSDGRGRFLVGRVSSRDVFLLVAVCKDRLAGTVAAPLAIAPPEGFAADFFAMPDGLAGKETEREQEFISSSATFPE
ncbi:MAG: hypothetical protein ACREFR_11645, partial [Limisphaerales bacterium]